MPGGADQCHEDGGRLFLPKTPEDVAIMKGFASRSYKEDIFGKLLTWVSVGSLNFSIFHYGLENAELGHFFLPQARGPGAEKSVPKVCILQYRPWKGSTSGLAYLPMGGMLNP